MEKEIEILSMDPFKLCDRDRYVACVGDNGGTDNETIWMGFRDSALILIDNIVNHNGTEDELIYPIVYCCRHSFELCLKIVIEKIREIYKIKGMDSHVRIEDIHTHNLESLNIIVCQIYSVDRRIKPIYDKIIPFLSDYEFDEKGDVFKYETDQSGVPHLKRLNISQISITILKVKFIEAMKLCNYLIFELEYYIKEYKLHVFTNKLSREDIKEISKQLPKFAKWSTDGIKETKNSLKEKYQIGNKEFDIAIEIIKQHREFCANIGLEIIFGMLSDEDIDTYCNLVKYYSENEKGSKLHKRKAGDDFKESLHIMQKRHKEIENITCSLDIESIICIATFHDIGKEYEAFSEKIMYYYNNYKENSDIDRNWLLGKIGKTRACAYTLRGMKMCGQTSYYKKLSEGILEKNIIIESAFNDEYGEFTDSIL